MQNMPNITIISVLFQKSHMLTIISFAFNCIIRKQYLNDSPEKYVELHIHRTQIPPPLRLPNKRNVSCSCYLMTNHLNTKVGQ